MPGAAESYVSKIKDANGMSYKIKDAEARTQISELSETVAGIEVPAAPVVDTETETLSFYADDANDDEEEDS